MSTIRQFEVPVSNNNAEDFAERVQSAQIPVGNQIYILHIVEPIYTTLEKITARIGVEPPVTKTM